MDAKHVSSKLWLFSSDYQVVDVHNAMLIQTYVMNRNSLQFWHLLHSWNARAFYRVPLLSCVRHFVKANLVREHGINSIEFRIACNSNSQMPQHFGFYCERAFLFTVTGIIEQAHIRWYRFHIKVYFIRLSIKYTSFDRHEAVIFIVYCFQLISLIKRIKET